MRQTESEFLYWWVVFTNFEFMYNARIVKSGSLLSFYYVHTLTNCIICSSSAFEENWLGEQQCAGPRDCVWSHVQDGYDGIAV